MTTLVPLELSVVVVANSHNPSLLNPDFLRFNDIVPRDWQLEGDPICAGPLAQVTFAAGVNVLAQPDRVVFSESLIGKESTQLGTIARKFVETLPHVDYTQLGINPKIFGSSKNFAELTSPFLSSQLKAGGEWTKVDATLKTVSLKFSYDVGEDWILNLGLDEGELTEDIAPVKKGILFAGNFHKTLAGGNKEDRLKNLVQCLGECQDRVDKMVSYIRPFVAEIE